MGSAEAVLAEPGNRHRLPVRAAALPQGLLLATVRAGKHILTTKPLGPSVAVCLAMVKAVGVRLAGSANLALAADDPEPLGLLSRKASWPA